MKKHTFKFLMISLVVTSTLFGFGIQYTNDNGLAIGSDRAALAFDGSLWQDDWQPCNATVLVMGSTGPHVVIVPGFANDCKFQWYGTCTNEVSCSPVIAAP